MQGDKIAKAREAAIAAIDRLLDSDVVSAVIYDSTCQVLVPATKASDRAMIQQKIRSIEAGGVRILQLLYQNAGAVVDRHRLMDHCWGQGYLPASRTIDQHISQLRKRIEQEPSRPKIIQTVHGAGYRFDPDSTG